MTYKVAVLVSSRADEERMEPARDALEELGIECDWRVMSAHKTPAVVQAFASSAADSGYGAVICGAGGAAHLAGAVAAHTTLPVIGVPLSTSVLSGQDALLATVQMPPGVPVATVAIDGARNAALLAVQILAVTDPELSKKLVEFKAKLATR